MHEDIHEMHRRAAETMLHDLAQQAFANAVVLACPVVLACFDSTPELSVLEFTGYAIWLLAWLLESAADSQKLYFASECANLPREEAATVRSGFEACSQPRAQTPQMVFRCI